MTLPSPTYSPNNKNNHLAIPPINTPPPPPPSGLVERKDSDAELTTTTTTTTNSIASSNPDSPSKSRTTTLHPRRPNLSTRKSSGTMIISSDPTATTVVNNDIDIDDNDVRSMSPRRNSEELHQLGEAARRDLIEQAKLLQMSLQAIVDRVEAVKSEHEKLEGGNKFLQSYIGELMQTSKITSTTMSKKGKTRPSK